jgi:hypothetical protein
MVDAIRSTLRLPTARGLALARADVIFIDDRLVRQLHGEVMLVPELLPYLSARCRDAERH